MNLIRILVLSVVLATSAHAKYVPTPEMAMSFNMDRDTTKWVPQFMDGDKSGIIFELVPEGESIDAWKEMVAQQIAFTKVSLRRYVDEWKAGLLKADSNIDMEEHQMVDGSIIVTYSSSSSQEASIRRFIKAKDGIYMLAYHVRPSLRDESRWAIWREIVGRASLVPNPQKRR